MTPRLRDVLRAKERGAPGELVWPSRTGKPISQASKVFRDVVNQLGLNDGIEDRRQRICFHSLRHSAASMLVQSGCDIYAVQAVLGHRNVSTTQRYSHLAPENMAAAAAILSKACEVDDAPVSGKVVRLRKAGNE